MSADRSHRPLLPRHSILAAVSPLEGLRKLRELRAYLRENVSIAACYELLGSRMAEREECFLRILRDGILPNPQNPSARLLRGAGIGYGDVRRAISRAGLQGALSWLRQAGVYLTLDEMKGRVAVERNGCAFAVAACDVRTTAGPGGFSVSTGGSRGRAARVSLGFDYLRQNSVNLAVAVDMCVGIEAPVVQWFPILPSPSGLMNSLSLARMGAKPVRWFAQTVESTPAHRLTTIATLQFARAFGRALSPPVPAPLSRPDVVLSALLRLRDAAGRCVLKTYVSSALRVCREALARGAPLDGVYLLTTSEPLTAARRELMERAGAAVTQTYWITEIGLIGVGCARCTSAPDEVHLFGDLVAVNSAENGAEPALCFTPLQPACPTAVINLQVGDAGLLGERPCDCPLGRLGMRRTVSHVHSTSRLSAEGMTLPTTELISLVDRVLPARFGGEAGDYQIIERSGSALTRLEVRVSPRLGSCESAQVRDAVLEYIASRDELVGRLFRQAGAVTVRRQQPEATAVGKMHPVLLRATPSDASAPQDAAT